MLSAKFAFARRSVQRQMQRRRLERMVKVGVIALVRLCRLRQLGWARIAALIRLPLATLRRWCSDWQQDRLKLSARGRPLQRAATELRNAVLGALGLLGPGVSTATLRELFPTAARRELEAIVARYRRVFRKRGVLVHQLQWENRGAVWAVDFTEAPAPIDARFPYVLSVRDVAAGKQLLALPAPDTSAQVVCDALRALFAEHQPPLVLKSDNGAAFIAEPTRKLLERYAVQHLLSPPGTPSYNGACEAGIGGIKTRAHYQAARHGRPGHWTCDDVEAARLMTNQTARPLGELAATPDELWTARMPTCHDDRALLHQAVEEARTVARVDFDHAQHAASAQRARDAITRIAICRALIKLGYLQLRRRRVSHPISFPRVLINS